MNGTFVLQCPVITPKPHLSDSVIMVAGQRSNLRDPGASSANGLDASILAAESAAQQNMAILKVFKLEC